MRVMDAVDYLKSNVPYTYYPNAFPSSAPNDCATVILTGGGERDTNVGRPSLQVIIRAAHPLTADDKAWEIYGHFDNVTNLTVGTTTVIFCAPQQSSPLYIGTDESARSLYSVNFNMITEV
jgi:hypothetical protein